MRRGTNIERIWRAQGLNENSLYLKEGFGLFLTQHKCANSYFSALIEAGPMCRMFALRSNPFHSTHTKTRLFRIEADYCRNNSKLDRRNSKPIQYSTINQSENCLS
jgi:hypothetical protein